MSKQLTPEAQAAIAGASTRYFHAAQHGHEAVVDALCATFKDVTGKKPDDKLREAIYQAIRFDC